MEIVKTALIGMIIGMANVIPGVSGSTMAVVFNIYDRFVNAITLNIKKLWNNKKFVLPLLCGMALGILFFSKIITFLYDKYQLQTNYFFTGLIAGSLPLLFSFAFEHDNSIKFSLKKIFPLILCIVAGFSVMIVFSMVDYDKNAAQELTVSLPTLTLPLFLLLFASGILGALAMIIPGISGSLLILMLGVYPVIMKAISSLTNPDDFFKAFFILFPVGCGVLTGLLLGALLIKTLIKKFKNQSYAVILGLLAGSIIIICPGVNDFSSPLHACLCFICLFTGFALAFFSAKCGREDKVIKEDNSSLVEKTESIQ